MDTIEPSIAAVATTPRRRRRPQHDPVHAAGSKVGGLRRWRGPDHPDTIAAEQDLATEQLASYAEQIVADFPPLRPEQVERIRAILGGVQ